MESKNKVIWTESAKVSFTDILDFLQFTWGQKQVDDFYNLTDKIIERISKNPFQFSLYNDSKEVRRALVHKNVSLFFRRNAEEGTIFLMLFFDNRQKPIQFKS